MVSLGRLAARGALRKRRLFPADTASGNFILIVTEGKKTEPSYLRSVLERLNLRTVEILHPDATDPLTLTREAIKKRDERRKTAKRSNFLVPYDEVWVVYDLEQKHDERRKIAAQARNLGKSKGIKFAESDPSFEYWLLLHERFTTRPFPDCHAVINELKEFLPEYSKDLEVDSKFLEKLPTAMKRSQQCRDHHIRVGGDGNPATDLDLLIRSLNKAAQRHYRFILD